MYAETPDWIRMRAKHPGACIVCKFRFAKGSFIAWHPISGMTKCGYCADGKDRIYEQLPTPIKQLIDHDMTNVRQMSNLPDRSDDQQAQLNESIELLKRYKHVRTVRRFIDTYKL